ncbi:MAG TPA: hemolysin III family protein [Acidimicrobiia bacterium]|nr:hemolysin III family protein [Acidimicrobiia bacterium]
MVGLQIGRMQNPVRGILHGSSAVVSVVGLVALLGSGLRGGLLVSVAIYGLSLIALYTTSSLYHSVPWREVWKGRLQRLDHTMIYVLVAGSFTPFLVAGVGGPWLVVGLVGIWGLAAVGLAREVWLLHARPFFIAQLILGAACAVPLLLILTTLDPTTAMLIVAGGVTYLVGVVMFANHWPRLLPGVFSHHELFHVFVVTASIAHFVAVWRIVSGG